MIENIISAHTKERRKKETGKIRPDLGGEGGRVYVLCFMVVTFPTSHLERSPLKALATKNTAPIQRSSKEKFNDKNRLKKKRRILFK